MSWSWRGLLGLAGFVIVAASACATDQGPEPSVGQESIVLARATAACESFVIAKEEFDAGERSADELGSVWEHLKQELDDLSSSDRQYQPLANALADLTALLDANPEAAARAAGRALLECVLLAGSGGILDSTTGETFPASDQGSDDPTGFRIREAIETACSGLERELSAFDAGAETDVEASLRRIETYHEVLTRAIALDSTGLEDLRDAWDYLLSVLIGPADSPEQIGAAVQTVRIECATAAPGRDQ